MVKKPLQSTTSGSVSGHPGCSPTHLISFLSKHRRRAAPVLRIRILSAERSTQPACLCGGWWTLF